MSTLDQHTAIENYLNGLLSSTEKAAFEKQLQSDPVLQEELEMHKMANGVVVDGAMLELKAQMQAIHAESVQQKTASKRKWWVWGSAAIVLISVVALLMLDNKGTKPNNSKEIAEVTEANETIEKKEQPKAPEANTIESANENHSNESKFINEDRVGKEIQPEQRLEEQQELVNENEPITNSNSTEASTEQNKPNLANDNTAKEEPDAEENEEALKQVNRCLQVKSHAPLYQVEEPVFGGQAGKIEFYRKTQNGIYFSLFSIDGGKSFTAKISLEITKNGTYMLVAKDDNGCLSKTKEITIGYAKTNYVVHPSQYKFWEMNIPDNNGFPVQLEIKNARTGQTVFGKTFNSTRVFSWKGQDNTGKTVAFGNYVYVFTSANNGLLATGQVTVIN